MLYKNSTIKEKKVISFSLYGSEAKYTMGALRNVELQKAIYPGWICRFYVNGFVSDAAIGKLIVNGAEIRRIISNGICPMYWRFLVADDENVDVFIIRDVDSRLSMREKNAVDEWLSSKKMVHLMRDHPSHNYLINGGLWGAKKGFINTSIERLILKYNCTDSYFQDMEFLNSILWPLIKNIQMSHDSFYCGKYPNSRSFPTRRMGMEHVGQVYNEFDSIRTSDLTAFKTRGSPIKCRRKAEYYLG